MVTILLIIIYIAFISLGLPDAVIGAAWPSIYTEFNIPVSWAGITTMFIASGTIFSCICTDFLKKRLGTGLIMIFSVFLTALAIFGFSISKSFFMLILFCIPYGLGAGCVDAVLNNYVALNYKARHMGFLHCFWGIGCMSGPFFLGTILSFGGIWQNGFKGLSLFQLILVFILTLSFPLWKKIESKNLQNTNDEKSDKFFEPQISPNKQKTGIFCAMFSFFCYCSMEATFGLWSTTFMFLGKNIELNLATKCGMLYFLGITIGRFFTGLILEKLGKKKVLYFGLFFIFLGIFILLLTLTNKYLVFLGLILVGLGSGPIYPCMIAQTPFLFGKEKSQSLIGFQMASAYTGTTFMPFVFGFLTTKLTVNFLPFFTLFFAILLFILNEKKNRLIQTS